MNAPSRSHIGLISPPAFVNDLNDSEQAAATNADSPSGFHTGTSVFKNPIAVPWENFELMDFSPSPSVVVDTLDGVLHISPEVEDYLSVWLYAHCDGIY